MNNAMKKERATRRTSLAKHAIAWSVMGLSAAALAGPDMKPRAMTEAERAEILNEAVQASYARTASAEERAMLQLSREEARALLAKEKPTTKALGTSKSVLSVRTATSGAMVVGNALLSNSSVVLTSDGKHLHSCSTHEHAHDTATQAKIEATARALAAAKGGVRE